MIVDHIKNIGRYNIPSRKEIARFLATLDLKGVFKAEQEINGRELFLRCAQTQTRDPKDGKFETHREYMDLQYVVEGREIMETAPADVCSPLTEYDSTGDCQFFKVGQDISRTLVRAGEFAVFFPGEAHRPLCSPDEGSCEVRKLIFKIRIKP